MELESGDIYAGHFPNKQLKKVHHWLAENSKWALEVFHELNPELQWERQLKYPGF